MKFRASIYSGSRRLDWGRLGMARDQLIGAHRAPGFFIAIHGDNPGGLDAYVEHVCKQYGIPRLRMPAPWDHFQPRAAAGPFRNGKMLDVLMAVQSCGFEIDAHCYPDADSTGTRDMIRSAADMRVTTHIVEL